MREYFQLGKTVYDVRKSSQFRRMLVFVFRCMVHHKKVRDLQGFFTADETLRRILASNPEIYEQLTRHVFYHKSSVPERLALIKDHYGLANEKIRSEHLLAIYDNQPVPLWSHAYGEDKIDINLIFLDSDKKEGLMCVVLNINQKRIYHITFWFGKNAMGEPVIYIGSLQGKRGGATVIHDLTKYFSGYRPKNLILFVLRIIAAEIGAVSIRAVSNLGFHTNNHVRADRKLRTDLDEFWEETGGVAEEDKRFYQLPVAEPFKSDEEIPARKRGLYRKRFAAMEVMKQQVIANLRLCLKTGQ